MNIWLPCTVLVCYDTVHRIEQEKSNRPTHKTGITASALQAVELRSTKQMPLNKRAAAANGAGRKKRDPIRVDKENRPAARTSAKKTGITASALRAVKLRSTKQKDNTTKSTAEHGRKKRSLIDANDLRKVKLRHCTPHHQRPRRSCTKQGHDGLDSVLRRSTLQRELRKKFANARSPDGPTTTTMSPGWST